MLLDVTPGRARIVPSLSLITSINHDTNKDVDYKTALNVGLESKRKMFAEIEFSPFEQRMNKICTVSYRLYYFQSKF